MDVIGLLAENLIEDTHVRHKYEFNVQKTNLSVLS